MYAVKLTCHFPDEKYIAHRVLNINLMLRLTSRVSKQTKEMERRRRQTSVETLYDARQY